MYRKKLAVRAMTAIATGALLISNVSVAVASTDAAKTVVAEDKDVSSEKAAEAVDSDAAETVTEDADANKLSDSKQATDTDWRDVAVWFEADGDMIGPTLYLNSFDVSDISGLKKEIDKWLKKNDEFEGYSVSKYPSKEELKEGGSIGCQLKAKSKKFIVNFVDRDGNPVLSNSIDLPADTTQVNTSKFNSILPTGYHLVTLGDVALDEYGEFNVVVEINELVDENKSFVVNFVDRDGNPVLSNSIDLPADTTQVNTSKFNSILPTGYHLVTLGDVALDEYGEFNVVVEINELVDENKSFVVNFNDRNGKNVLSTSIDLPADTTIVNTSMFKDILPSGYKLVTLGDVSLDEYGAFNVIVEINDFVDENKSFVVNFNDRDGKNVLSTSIDLPADTTQVNTSKFNSILPTGYHLVTLGDVALDEYGAFNVVVEINNFVDENKSFMVNFNDRDGKNVLSTSIDLPADTTIINTSKFKDILPSGYKLVTLGDVSLDEYGAFNVVVEINDFVDENKSFVVNFNDRDGKNVLSTSIDLPADTTIINTSKFKDILPSGYKLVTLGDVSLDEYGAFNVVVELNDFVDENKSFVVNFNDRDGKNVLSTSIDLPADTTIINTSKFKDILPSGYKLVTLGDVSLDEYGAFNVVVEINDFVEETKTFIINFIDRDGKNVLTTQIELPAGTTIINTSKVANLVPAGYQIAIVGDLQLDTTYNAFNVTVEPKENPEPVKATAQVTLLQNGSPVGSVEITDAPVDDKDALKAAINAAIADKNLVVDGELPEGGWYNNIYKLTVNVVRAKTTAQVTLLQNGAPVGSVEIADAPVDDKDALKAAINAAIADKNLVVDGELPEGGWDNGVYKLTVNVKATETPAPDEKVELTVEYVDADGKTVATGKVTVNKNDTTVSADQLTDVPEGYDVTGTTFDIKDGKVVVTVQAKENPKPDDKAVSTVTINFMRGQNIAATQTFNREGKKGDTFTVTKADVDTSVIPSAYNVYKYFDDTTVAYGENVTLQVELKAKNSGNGGGSGSSGGGSSVSTGASGVLTAGTWKLDDKGWWYQYTNNTYAKNGWYTLEWQNRLDWYYFDAEGYLVSGWYTDANGNRFYLHPLHDGTFGRMYTGWNKVDGAWQFFNDNTEAGVYGAWQEGTPVPAELANA